MNNEEQLQWETRLGRPAAFAAFAAGLLLLAGTVVFQSLLENRPGVRSLPDFLLSANESPGTLIGATVIQGVAALLLTVVFYYLFRATVHRTPGMPNWFVYFIVIGPLMYGVSQVIGALDRVDVAETFAQQSSNLGPCPAIEGERGLNCAEDLLREDPNPVSIGLSLAGSVAVAFLFVMMPLRARRAGLLSPFMSILGVIAGVLLVLQLLPLVPVIIQAFWLGAIGALFLGAWPGGRGPAWETGTAAPWPRPAARRGAARRGADEPPQPDDRAAGNGVPPDDEPAPQRPSSRKRRRKRR